MEGKHIKTFDAGRYSFEVWQGSGEWGPCFVTVVRTHDREGRLGPPAARRIRAESLVTAMRSATSLANRLQLRAEAQRPEKTRIEDPRPTSSLLSDRCVARPFLVDGLLKKALVKRGRIRVLSRSSDSLELLITKEEES